MTNFPFTIGQKIHPGLAKVVEELSELQVELAKLIANNGEYDYWDGRDLKKTIAEELADATAAIAFFINFSDLNIEMIKKRTKAKEQLFLAWHNGSPEAELSDFMDEA